MKGIFIVVEGGEGAGKSTVCKALGERLTKAGYDVVVTREPGGCDKAEKIREIIMNTKGLNPMAEAGLFASARAIHNQEVIKPALEAGKIVICDRYILSNMVYQGYMNEKDVCSPLIHNILEMNEEMGNIMPDYTLYMDIDPKVGLARISKTNRDTNRFDELDIEKHEIIREGFLKLLPFFESINMDTQPIEDYKVGSGKWRFYQCVNAGKDIESVLEELESIVKTFIAFKENPEAALYIPENHKIRKCDFDMSYLCRLLDGKRLKNRTMSSCEQTCEKYYQCENIALANDILKIIFG